MKPCFIKYDLQPPEPVDPGADEIKDEPIKLAAYVYEARKYKPLELAMKARSYGFDMLHFGCWIDGSAGPTALGGNELVEYMQVAADLDLRVGLWAYPNKNNLQACLRRVYDVASEHSTKRGCWVAELLANTERHMKGSVGAWHELREQWYKMATELASWSALAPYGMLRYHDGPKGLPIDSDDPKYYPTIRPMFYSVAADDKNPENYTDAADAVRDLVARGWLTIGPSVPGLRPGWPDGPRAPTDLYSYVVQIESAIEAAGAVCDRMAVWQMGTLTHRPTIEDIKDLTFDRR